MRLFSFLEHSECVFLLGDARGWAEGQSGFQQAQKKETGKGKYVFFKASINPLKKLHLYVYFFPGSRLVLGISRMKKLDSWEPKEQHETSTTNIHDLWFRQLLVNKQWDGGEKWANKSSSDRGLTRPPSPSVSQCCCDVWKDLYSDGFLSDGLKWKCQKWKKPSSLGTKSRSTDWLFLLWVSDFHCFQWLTWKRAPEVVMNTFKIPPVSGWLDRKRKNVTQQDKTWVV